MAREFARKFYNSKLWKDCKESYKAKRRAIDGGLCETCHKEYGYIVHHKIWLNEVNINIPEISLNHDNLKYDCLTCHNKESETEQRERIIFDEDGQPMPVYTPPVSD